MNDSNWLEGKKSCFPILEESSYIRMNIIKQKNPCRMVLLHQNQHKSRLHISLEVHETAKKKNDRRRLRCVLFYPQ